MVKAARLLSFDAFAKTVEDARVKTASGGIVTIVCIISILVLLFNEYLDYSTIVIRPELVVDRERNQNLEFNIDISFHSLPCEAITMDILDLTGDTQIDLLRAGFKKQRIVDGKVMDGSEELIVNQDMSALSISEDPNYCGSCYGSIDQSKNDEKPQNEKVCCNTCEAVRQAYAEVAWKFYDGENIEQCEKEGYTQKIKERLNEGCRIIGSAELNKIGGNLHFAPGASVTMRDRHVHDLSLYDKYQDKFNFDHTINHFSFGSDHHSSKLLKTNNRDIMKSVHPLDGITKKISDKYQLFSYYLKVVATRYEYLDGDVLETNQFSVTAHDRPLRGGRDEDHPNTIHARGGIPGVFIHFDISPMKIINREQYKESWSSFLLGACSSIAGVLTVGAILDKTIWTADRILRQKKDL